MDCAALHQVVFAVCLLSFKFVMHMVVVRAGPSLSPQVYNIAVLLRCVTDITDILCVIFSDHSCSLVCHPLLPTHMHLVCGREGRV